MGRIDWSEINALPGAIAKPTPKKRAPTTGAHSSLARTKGVNPRNRERLERRRVEEFGEHADWIRTLPCVACLPVLYDGEDVVPVLKMAGQVPISDACHVRTRGAGGKAEANLYPGCRLHHQQEGSWGQDSFEASYQINLERIAAMLWEVSPARPR